jgi:hypothetical protein
MVVRLVDQHVSRRGNRLEKAIEIGPPCEAAGRVVRIADVDQPRVAVHGRQHGVEIVGVRLRQWDGGKPGPGICHRFSEQREAG